VTKESEIKGFVVNIDGLPVSFPTHRHDATFWESLGRTVATFGFLEEILGKTIFVFHGNTSANPPYDLRH
jgi:hypothetical protein